MRKTINWGVLGAASIAVERTLPAMLHAPSARLLGLASRDPVKAQKVAQALEIARVYDSYDALLADPDIDAVYIPLPNQLHFQWSLRAMEAGKHVLCEKPLCLTVEQVEQLCEARDRTGCFIEEGFAFRNHPQWQVFDDPKVREAIGSVRAVHLTLAKQFLDPADIRNDPQAGGGALYDFGCYAIAACNLVFKRQPKRVVAALDFDPDFGIDRLSSALLDYGDCHATLTVAMQAGPSGWGSHQTLSVLGSTGWLRFDFPCAHARPTACRVEVGDATSVGSFASKVLEFEPVNQYTLQFEGFSRLVLGDAAPGWPIEDALSTLETVEALFESARTGGWKNLQDSTQSTIDLARALSE